jgi:sugar transport system permease protein
MKQRLQDLFRKHMLEVILILLYIILAAAAPGFFSVRNFLNILRNSSMQGIIAFGMTMVIISGEIDLSVGSAVAFSGCITAWMTRFLAVNLGLPIGAAVAAAILTALAVGFLVGSLTAFIRNTYQVPTFIITLAFMTTLSGFANLITGGFPITPFPQWFNFFGGGYILGIPFPAIIFLLVFLIIQFIMTSTTFGRSIYAVGGNLEAARLTGIDVRKIKIIIMGLTASLSALSGVMVSSLIMSGSSTAAKGWELDVVSSVIIGGTALTGGRGTVWGTFIGILFLGTLVNGMTLLNISEYWQYVVRGGLILGAVLLNTIQAQRLVTQENREVLAGEVGV